MSESEEPQEHEKHSVSKEHKTRLSVRRLGRKKVVAITAAVIAIPVLLFTVFYGYIYASSPEVIRKPLLEHYHFRMQIVVNGKAENFASNAYQTGYSKDNCNVDLPAQPIHFHDKKDQMVHIHWEGITGGMVMKYYGWNYIGGKDDVMGYKMDGMTNWQKMPIHGKVLPAAPKDASFYIYTGDEVSYRERRFDSWKNQDLEEFFGVTSNFPAHEINKQQRSLLDTIFPKAYAHEGHEHSATSNSDDPLQRLNNLLGNVVIFVQKDRPSDEQVKDRFNKLEPLSDSTCAG